MRMTIIIKKKDSIELFYFIFFLKNKECSVCSIEYGNISIIIIKRKSLLFFCCFLKQIR